MERKIAVFCSSADEVDEKYKEAARQFAKAASLYKWNIICGAADRGLMKVIVEQIVACGGHVTGIVPLFMHEEHIEHKAVKDIEFVSTLAERKRKMRCGASSVIVFPGGIGTLDEFFDTLALKCLGKFDGEIIIFNQDGFYDQLLVMLDDMMKKDFISAGRAGMFKVADTLDDLILFCR